MDATALDNVHLVREPSRPAKFGLWISLGSAVLCVGSLIVGTSKVTQFVTSFAALQARVDVLDATKADRALIEIKLDEVIKRQQRLEDKIDRIQERGR